jgi:hypothetical protein
LAIFHERSQFFKLVFDWRQFSFDGFYQVNQALQPSRCFTGQVSHGLPCTDVLDDIPSAS